MESAEGVGQEGGGRMGVRACEVEDVLVSRNAIDWQGTGVTGK